MRKIVKIGFPTHPRRNILDEIRWIGENGFDFVDLFIEPDICDFSSVIPKEIKSLLNDLHLDNVGHTAWYLPIGSAMKNLRIKAVDILKSHFEVFKEIGCKKVTIHANWPGSMFSQREGVKLQMESISALVGPARDAGIKILYESVTTAHDNKENISKILSAFPEIAFHADIGHLNLCGRNPTEYLMAFKDRIEHIHLHDNDSSYDQHLPMGVGKIDWVSVVETLKSFYNSTITLEIFSPEREYAILSRRILRRMWETSDNP